MHEGFHGDCFITQKVTIYLYTCVSTFIYINNFKIHKIISRDIHIYIYIVEEFDILYLSWSIDVLLNVSHNYKFELKYNYNLNMGYWLFYLNKFNSNFCF